MIVQVNKQHLATVPDETLLLIRLSPAKSWEVQQHMTGQRQPVQSTHTKAPDIPKKKASYCVFVCLFVSARQNPGKKKQMGFII